MRFIIFATIFSTLAAYAAAALWTEICPPFSAKTQVCTVRDERNNYGRTQFFLTFPSTCFLEQHKKEQPWREYKAIAAPGKSCEQLGYTEAFINF